MKNLAIFASGNGSNAENLIRYFSHSKEIAVKLVLSNRLEAGVLRRAKNLKVKTAVFSKPQLQDTEYLTALLKEHEIDWIVLAGFLLKIPEWLIEKFPSKIINIHPALLPNYGGKGMFGNNVHEAVIRNKEAFSGITIHYVNEQYDEGKVIFQAKIALEDGETPETLAKKIHELEYRHFPAVIEKEVLEN